MQTIFFLVAAVLYGTCALLPSRQGTLISTFTAIAWLLHGAGLWIDTMLPGSVRLGFAMMLSSALWISVGAYWIENRNFALDGMRRLVMPFALAASLLPLLFPGQLLPLQGKTPVFGWHIAIAIM